MAKHPHRASGPRLCHRWGPRVHSGERPRHPYLARPIEKYCRIKDTFISGEDLGVRVRTAVAPSRLVNAFRAVLPTHATARAIPIRGRTVPVADVEVLGSVVHLVWAGEGWPRDIERAVAVGAARPGAVVVVKRMSPGAAAAAVAAGLGWVDEDGGADFTTPTLAVARTARPSLRPARPAHWTAQ